MKEIDFNELDMLNVKAVMFDAADELRRRMGRKIHELKGLIAQAQEEGYKFLYDKEEFQLEKLEITCGTTYLWL